MIRKILIFVIAAILVGGCVSAAEPPVAPGIYDYTDDCTTLDNLFEYDGILGVNTSRFGQNAMGPSGTQKAAYAVYKLGGEITGYDIRCIIYLAVNYEDAFNEDNAVAVSSDGVNWQKCKSKMEWGNQYGDATNTPTGGGYNIRFINNGAVPEGANYLKINFPVLKDGVTAGDYERALSKVMINQYIGKVRASVKGGVLPENTLDVDFSAVMDETAAVPELFGFKNGPEVVGAELINGGKTVRLTLSENLEGSSQYKLFVSPQIKSAEGYFITDGTEIEVNTKKGAGEYTYEDNPVNLDNAYSISGEFQYFENMYNVPVYGLAAGQKEGTIVYFADGDITGFSFDTVIHGASSLADRYFSVYLSSDGKNYTKLSENRYSIKGTSDTVTTYALHELYDSEGNTLPENMKYLKIVFPRLADGNDGHSHQRCIASVKINYAIRPVRVYKTKARFDVDETGKGDFKALLSFSTDLQYPVTAENVSVKNSDIVCTNVTYSETENVYICEFDKCLDFEKDYTLVLSGEIMDIYGLVMEESAKSVKLSTGAKPKKTEVISGKYKYMGTMDITQLTEGNITCNVTVKGIYFDGSASDKVTVISVVYSGDKITEVKAVTEDVYVGREKEIKPEIAVSTSDTSVETFVINNPVDAIPLCDSMILK